jgi:serine/threonine protein kinase
MPFVDDAQELVHLKDTPSPLAFGKRQEAGDSKHLSSSPNWFWEFRGQVMILSSPHLVGKHFATTIGQLLGVVEHLEKLHNKGYVHGDIRAYNIVFIEEDVKNGIKPNGFLIDFDLSGKEGEELTKYPEGYATALEDGRRPAKAGNQITKQGDWLALRSVLFFVHQIVPPTPHDEETSCVQTLREENCLLRKLSYYGKKFASKAVPTSPEISDLKQFLTTISTWDIMLEEEFQCELNSFRLHDNNTDLPESGRTRVSPSKQSNELVHCASTFASSDDASKSPRNKSGKRSWSPSAAKDRKGNKRVKSKFDGGHS